MSLQVRVRTLPGDLLTPVAAYWRLRSPQAPAALLESVVQGGPLGRYSIAAFDALIEAALYSDHWRVREPHRTHPVPLGPQPDPFAWPRRALETLRPPSEALPPTEHAPFPGGWLGYWAYDVVRFWEPLPHRPPDDRGLPWAWLMLPRVLLVWDHSLLTLVAFGWADEPAAALDARLDQVLARLHAPMPPLPEARPPTSPPVYRSSFRRADFLAAVERAQAYIAAGDIFQVVLSQRLRRATEAHPYQVYRALRQLNPSPYMFLLEHPRAGWAFVGASPEMLVRLRDRVAETRPIAGTRPRGATPDEDRALEAELRADPKERAEHVMLVDLGRNDLGRVSTFGTVRVPEFMVVERYSHVMHLVSRVTGQLRADQDMWDLLRAAFPAGTVSGAPKVRAMQIIDELEPVARGPYAGAVGYFGFDGNMDTCITIRTLIFHRGYVDLQAGAGIVADSQPAREWDETLHKARALGVAVARAEHGFAAINPDIPVVEDAPSPAKT